MKEQVLKALHKGVSSGDVTNALNADRKDVDKAFAKVKKGCALASPAIASSLKAVTVAVLISISPMAATSANNTMRIKAIHNVEQVEESTRAEIIYAKSFATEKHPEITVAAINSKGNIDGFNQIIIIIDDQIFDVHKVYEVEAYLLSSNGVEEGPVELNRVIAYRNADNEKVAFIDNNITNYVKDLLSRKTNKSNILNLGHLKYYVIPSYENIFFCYSEGSQVVKDYLSFYEPDPYERFGTLMPNLTKDIQGTYGKYKLRFYNCDSDDKNYEKMTLQKEGEPEFRISGSMCEAKLQVCGIDTDIDIGGATVLPLYTRYHDSINNRNLFDDELTSKIIDILEKDGELRNLIPRPSLFHRERELIFFD